MKTGTTLGTKIDIIIDDLLKNKELAKLKLNPELVKKQIKRYEEETNKYAIWKDSVTEGFIRYLKGERIYDKDKERISFYVSSDIKENWLDFIKEQNISTISKLIREAVTHFIKEKPFNNEHIFKLDEGTLLNISHSLKEPLTSIKGFSQVLLENYKSSLDENILILIDNIFKQSKLLEEKIINILDEKKPEIQEIDVLLIDDDLSTNKLVTSYLQSKGFTCQGVFTARKGLELLQSMVPRIILLDIILPDISGFDLCQQLNQDKNLKELPIFLITAIPKSEVEKEIKNLNVYGYILKPFDLSDFEIIFKHLS